jgi:hypothetical protein
MFQVIIIIIIIIITHKYGEFEVCAPEVQKQTFIHQKQLFLLFLNRGKTLEHPNQAQHKPRLNFRPCWIQNQTFLVTSTSFLEQIDTGCVSVVFLDTEFFMGRH